MSAAAAFDYAKGYADRGWVPLPVRVPGEVYQKNGKQVIANGKEVRGKWADVKCAKDTITRFNGADTNVGVLLGVHSGWLTDIDLDCAEAHKLAPWFLPDTEAIFGRESTPQSHWLYVSPDCSSESFADPLADKSKAMLVEIRSSRKQSVFPGSVHHTGEQIEWYSEGAPVHVDKTHLHKAVRRLAAAALIARHWKAGTFHNGCLALAGGLLRAGWSKDETKHFSKAIATASGQSDIADRMQAIEDTAEKLVKDERTTGWNSLKSYLPPVVVDVVCKWLNITVAREIAGNSSTFDGIEPLDIFAEADRPVPVWNADHYPPVIAKYAEDIGRRTGADPAIPCWTALSICAAAIPDWIKIQVKANDPNWTEAARLWVMVAGMPSIKKSPPMAEVRKTLDELQSEWSRDFKDAMEHYVLDLDIYKERRKQYIKKPDDHPVPVPPEEPRLRRLIFTDSTIEGVARLLEHNPQGLLAFHDELSGWFGSMDAYRGRGVNKDRPDWLKLFNGGPHLVDRASGHRSIPNWSSSILGGIQPAPLKNIAKNLDDDGLLQRFIVIIANAASHDQDVMAHPEYAREYAEMVREFAGLTVPLTHKLSSAGQRLLTGARHEVQSWGTFPLFDTRLQTAFQKGEGILARLVLLFHYLGGRSQRSVDITPETVSRAVSLYKDYLAPSLTYFYGQMLCLSEGSSDARWIAGHILARGLTVINSRSIRRAYKAMRDSDKVTSADIAAVMDELFLAGWVDAIDTKIGRLPNKWDVNSLVHTRFAARAEFERQQREKVRREIQAKVKA